MKLILGLQSHIEPMDLGQEAEEVGGSVIEEDEAEDGPEHGQLEHGHGLTDLGNAPPLVDVPYDEVIFDNLLLNWIP